MAEIYVNLASALLAGNIVPGDLTLQVENGYGTLFPSPTGGDFCRLCIEDTDGNVEIVYQTARSGDVLTITRAQEGTSARGFTSGITRVEHRPTAGMFTKLLDTTGDTMAGALNFDGNTLTDALIEASTFADGVVKGSYIRATDGGTANQIFVPPSGADPTIGINTIFHAGNLGPGVLGSLAFPSGMITMWYGTEGSVPDGWAVCNGSSGTPDLRDKFVVGAGGAYSPTVGVAGGSSSYSGSTTVTGSHSHTVTPTALTVGQLPAHGHDIWGANGTGSGNAEQWNVSGARGIPGESSGSFAWRATNESSEPLISVEGNDEEHTHGMSTDGSHQHSVSIPSTLPPFVGLFYIMKL